MHNPSSKGKRSASLLGLNSGLTHHFILLYILVTKSLPHMFPITSTRSDFVLEMDSLPDRQAQSLISVFIHQDMQHLQKDAYVTAGALHVLLL